MEDITTANELQGETLNTSSPAATETVVIPVVEGETPEPTEQPQESIKELNARIKRMDAALKKANEEAKNHRRESDELKKFKEQTEAEKLTIQEKQELARQKLEKQVSDLQAQYESAVHESQSYKTHAEIRLEATRRVFQNPDDAIKFISMAEVELDERGSPTNVKELVDELLKARPYLGSPTQSKTTASSGGTTNPSRSQSNTVELTAESIAKMTHDEYMANRTRIQQLRAQGKI